MRAVRSQGTRPEIALRRELHRRGLRYRVGVGVLPRRRIDIAFTRARVAVQVHGCFWHGCDCRTTVPRANQSFWMAKIEANRARDVDTEERLEALGWRVITVWEHENLQQVADRVVAILTEEAAQPDSSRRSTFQPRA